MGCDIHAYIEYYNPDEVSQKILPDVFASSYVDVFASDIQFYRNYCLFFSLAGIRGMGQPPFTPRGLPTKPPVSWHVASQYYLKVVEETPNYDSRCITKKEAELYVDKGANEIYVNDDLFITDLNWHSASHLSLVDLISVRRNYLIEQINFECVSYKGKKRKEALDKIKSLDDYDFMKLSFPEIECAQLNATIGTMIGLENSGNYKTRLVFWFDS